MILINISNHPFEMWSTKQQQEAKRLYSDIVDIAFPNINPMSTHKDIMELANIYYLKIKSELSSTPGCVHLMGEQTFCYALLRILQEHNIEAIASTTERIVEMKGDKKIVTFSFVKFRNYF